MYQPLSMTHDDDFKDLCCPICGAVCLGAFTEENISNPPEPTLCPHGRFYFVDEGNLNWDLFSAADDEIAQWFDGLIARSLNEEEDEGLINEIANCPLVTHVVVALPSTPAPFARMIWGFSSVETTKNMSLGH